MTPHRTAAAALALLAAACTISPAGAQPAFPAAPPEAGMLPPPPGPRANYVVEPGHWQWRPRLARYTWVPRHWILVQPGYVHFVPGHWAGGVWVQPHWGP